MAFDPPENKGPVGEEEIIRLISSLAGEKSSELAMGIGDDAAVLHLGGGLWCVTTDLLVEGVHFDLAYMTPQELGRRAMAANLSDLAAMGSKPRFGFLSLGVGRAPEPEFLEGLIRGLTGLGREHGITLAGGDTVRSPTLVLNICLMGSFESHKPCLRSGALKGDAVCVTGNLGASRAGLGWLQAGRDPKDPRATGAVRAHVSPEPRVRAGLVLAQSGKVHAMMDLSDGLATDLARLAQASNLGAEVRAEDLPIAQSALDLAPELGEDPLQWALTGGEDFELLFTCEPHEVDLLSQLVEEAAPGLAVRQLGRMTKGKGVTLLDAEGETREIAFSGFDHFRGQDR